MTMTLASLRTANEASPTMPYITRAWYNKVFLTVNQGKLVHDQFGLPATQPKHSGEQHMWRRWPDLSTATVPLTEGITPDPTEITYENVIATLKWYGSWIPITDVVSFMHPDNILSIATKKLSRQAKESKDEITRDIINAGTSFIRVSADGSDPTNSAGARTEVNGIVTAHAVDTAVTTLESADVPYLHPTMNASTKVATQPIGPSYVAIVHPHQSKGFKNTLSGMGDDWVPREKYAGGTVAYPTEIGKYGNVRFITSTKAKKWTDTGGNTTVGTTVASVYRSTTGTTLGDVYSCLILGQEAFGTVGLKGASSTHYYAAGGNTDPIAQRATAGWKACFTAKILNENNMVRIEALAMW